MRAPFRFGTVARRIHAMSRFATKAPVAATTCAYEDERLANIARNRERMVKLGLFSLGTGIANAGHDRRLAEREKRARAPSKTGANARDTVSGRAKRPKVPTRRSGRLSGTSGPSSVGTESSKYAEIEEEEKSYTTETYTAEHRANLGTSKSPWTLFVDGYDKAGNRVYDQGRGATCHQCRQKTICKHTRCSHCQSLKGQFCGDCLWMRYGENVLEVIDAGEDWQCPSCRDLCNCSFCRHRKGYPPTGSMYRRAIAEGFESVAHYLVLGGEEEVEEVDEVGDEKSEDEVEETKCDDETGASTSDDDRDSNDTSAPVTPESRVPSVTLGVRVTQNVKARYLSASGELWDVYDKGK